MRKYSRLAVNIYDSKAENIFDLTRVIVFGKAVPES
jgi:hypothetical protein